jgi:hypothetical protein
MPSTTAPARTPFRVTADSIEACNCHHGCNCQFEGFPNEGFCEFIMGYDVTDGRFGDVKLDGVRFVVAAKYPGAIHEGHGHMVLFVDESATPEQTDAVGTILSGRMGSMPWEALAGTLDRLDGPFRKPIAITRDAERSRVVVTGAVELQLAPFVNAVTGQEKEVHITYPKGGFFWNDGRIATTDTMRVSYGDLALDWPRRYAATAPVTWTNQ